MLTIWFMFDNHTFKRVTVDGRETILNQVTKLFLFDGCGSVYVRDRYDGTLDSLTLDGHLLENGKYGVTAQELWAWVDLVMNELSFQRLMDA